jgi:apolipoprotein N-acyltransferase
MSSVVQWSPVPSSQSTPFDPSSSKNCTVGGGGDEETVCGRMQRSGAAPVSPFQLGPARVGPFWLTLISNALLWLAYPPVGWGWLAWVAPVPMLMLVFTADIPRAPALVKVWGASFLFWLATFYFIPLPHPILILGWLALSAYLAIYTPLVLVTARALVWRWGVWTVIAVPIAWTGWEWVRMNFLTGFGMVGLSHSQYDHPLVIQVADLSGAYTLTFAMAAFAAGVASACWSVMHQQNSAGGVIRSTSLAVASCLVVATAVAGYGWVKLAQVEAAIKDGAVGESVSDEGGEANVSVAGRQALDSHSNRPSTFTIALIQTSIDTVLQPKTESQEMEELVHLRDVNWAARQASDAIDLIVWPESSYRYGNHISDRNDAPEVQTSQANLKEIWSEVTHAGRRFRPVPTIIGTSTIDIHRQQIFNSAILVDDSGLPTARYDKMHRVMFGEYVPVLEYLPSLMQYLPIARNLTPGTSAKLFDVEGFKIAPNVCFETTVPHLIRKHVNKLAVDQGEPDALLNITNDGWFFGTSCLDLHFACNVFRAVELRKPMLVCANTGLSAHIDRWGIVRQKGGRRVAQPLICEIDFAPVATESTNLLSQSSVPSSKLLPGSVSLVSSVKSANPISLYRSVGDIVPMLLGGVCVISVVISTRSPSLKPQANSEVAASIVRSKITT